MNENGQKTILRAPPKQVDLTDSLQSIRDYILLPEEKHFYYVRIILLITDILALGLGIYILINHNKFFNVSFKYHDLLLIFVYIYSPSAIGIFFVSFIFSVFIYIFYCCFEKERIHGAPLYDETDITMSIQNLKDIEELEEKEKNQKEEEKETEKGNIISFENDSQNKNQENAKKSNKVEIKEEFIGITADKVTLLPYACTIFVIMTIVFYFTALPLSIILFKNMWKHNDYKNKKEYWALYTFISVILIDGILIVYVFLHMFIKKRIENRFWKKMINYDEDLLKICTNEVREALKKA